MDGPARPGHGLERAGDGPAKTVPVAGLDMDAGLLDLAAPDVETEHRERHGNAVLHDLVEGGARQPLSAQDAAGVGKEDLDDVDVA